MNKNPLISIVVPIYNGEKYIPDLLNCLTHQTYKNFEVLLIDDMSTDNSVKIISEYVANDSRFKLYCRTTKGGTAVAGQEYAMPLCTGDYYFFMSQDDFMDPDLLEKCISRAIKTNADIVMPNMVLYYEGKNNPKALDYPLNGDYETFLDAKTAFCLSLDWRVHGFVLRKMDLVKRIGYHATYYNSCEYAGRKMFLYANKIAFVDTNFYYRQDNPDAITKTIKWFTVDILTTDLMLVDLAIKHKCPRSIIRERIRVLRRALCGWTKQIDNPAFTSTQKKYIQTACRNAFCKLMKLSLQWLVFNRPIKFIIRGIKCI